MAAGGIRRELGFRESDFAETPEGTAAVGAIPAERTESGTARQNLLDGLRYIRRDGRTAHGLRERAAIALVPTLWLAAVLAAVIGLNAGVFGSLDNALIQTAADPAPLGRVTSVVRLTMVGVAPLSHPLVGADFGAWGAAPAFVGCGIFAGLSVVIALASYALRHAELPRQRPGVTT